MAESTYFDGEFADLAEGLLAEYHVPSISIAVVDQGRTYSKAYGLARFPSLPATPDTLYFTGSTTKAIIAAAIGVLIKNPDKVKVDLKSDGPLSWSTTIKSILGDDFVLQDKYVMEDVTIEDALCHRVGLSGHENIAGGHAGQRPRGLTQRLRYLGPLDKPFRTAFQYNNFMYAVAGDVLETLTGKTCGDALRDLLWAPLGMDRTFWEIKEVVDASHIDQTQDLSRGYFWLSEGKGSDKASTTSSGHYVPDEYFNFAGIAPAGSIISSVLDYTKWIQALLDASSGSASSTSPITTALYEELTAPRITTGIPLPNNAQLGPVGYALGWLILPSTLGPLHPIVCHSGGLSGYGTMLHTLPNDSFGVVTLGNTMLSSNLIGHILSQELIARKMGLKDAGRERELREFNLMMKAQNVALEQCVDIDNVRDNIDPAVVKDMFKKGAMAAGQTMSIEEFTPKSDENGTSSLQDLAGIYEHGAYGKLRISFASSASNTTAAAEKLGQNATLRHRFERDKPLIRLRDECRSACHSLRVQALGNRTWRFEHLLHPRAPSSDTSDENDSTTWFDQEFLWGHGFTADDIIPGLPTGTDEEEQQAGREPSGRCKSAEAWESVIWTRLGAACVRDSGKVKLGLTLANTHTGIDGDMEKGWERKKVWFERVEET